MTYRLNIGQYVTTFIIIIIIIIIIELFGRVAA